MISYELEVEPAEAVLGQEIRARLTCRNGQRAAHDVATFGHASLAIGLRSTEAEEPVYVFPNRRVIQSGGLLIREASPEELEDLEAGEQRTREFELTRLFPYRLLEAGQYELSYKVYDGNREHGPSAVPFRVVFLPISGEWLLARLRSSDPDLRLGAAEIMQRLTGESFGYDQAATEALRQAAIGRWAEWWRAYGAHAEWKSEHR